jgi:hypothetical protein
MTRTHISLLVVLTCIVVGCLRGITVTPDPAGGVDACARLSASASASAAPSVMATVVPSASASAHF